MAVILKDYLMTRDDECNSLFVSRKARPVSVSWLQRLVKTTGEQAGLPCSLTCNHLRHTFATYAADQHGKVEVYRIVALTALLPLFIVTNIGAAPLWLWISCTTIFFVLVSGRMIPGMAIITSAAQPKLRGTFMSLNGTTQALAMALASTLAGFMLSQNVTGEIVDYEWVGYVAITANILAIWFVPRIVMHDQNVVIPDVVPKQRVE